MEQEQQKSGWIWLPNWDVESDKRPVFIYFRKEMELKSVPERFLIHIFADSRYKLYVNERLVEVGPAKSNGKVWFYDELDIAPFLHEGINIWAIIVLHYPPDPLSGNQSVYRFPVPGLLLKRVSCDCEGTILWKADESWKVRRDTQTQIVSENPFFAPLQIYEEVMADTESFGWMQPEYDASWWSNAKEVPSTALKSAIASRPLQPRPIPFLRRIPGKFQGVSNYSGTAHTETQWEALLRDGKPISIPSYFQECIDIDAGELMTGYLHLHLVGGAQAQISILQSECYVEQQPDYTSSYYALPTKGKRSDSNGELIGNVDRYTVCGQGTYQEPEKYEPFWFRTFRYVRLMIRTSHESMVITRLDYTETGYPLEVQSHVSTSDPSLDAIWNISARTLKRCMHETYEDCPFYEQMQYTMDARSQILYTYAISADDRLARRCMEDFRCSANENGMLNARAPSVNPNVIPGFAVYYIGMLYDHMMYFGDKQLLSDHISTVEGVLNYYQRHLDKNGLLKQLGGVNQNGRNWSFIDWAKEWEATTGVPTTIAHGGLTMESLLYLLALQYAEALYRYLDKPDAAMNCCREGEKLKGAINKYCRGNDGMLQDGMNCEEYSQHCQVFAVLTDTISVDDGRRYLLETLNHREKYAQCSVAMMYYLFRALEKCELYEKTAELWDTWRVMLANDLTTCAEDSLTCRSDCHAWGALALYELPSIILGVRPGAPGYATIRVKPIPGTLHWARGHVITPRGNVFVEWKKENGKMRVKIDAPDGMKVLSGGSDVVTT